MARKINTVRLTVYNTGAYQWRNLVNGKVYVGGAYKDFEERKAYHVRDLRAGRHRNRHLQSAWKKYGEQAFTFEVLERCLPIKAVVIACEQKWIDESWATNPDYGYNLSPTAESLLGYKWGDESRARASKAHKGVPLSESHKAGLRAAAARPEVRERRRLAGLSRPPMSAETRAKLSIIHKGRKQSDKERQQRSESAIARELTPEGQEARRRTVASNVGKPKSEETKRRISASRNGKCRGENNPKAKLTERQAKTILRLCRKKVRQACIARAFKVSVATVQAIKCGRLWSYLSE